MPDKTAFTVLVPTRERADTLHYALRTLTQQRYEPLTIIVSDNAGADHTEEVVRRLGDSRVRYVNTGSRVSMSHNFEFALSHVQSGWVTFIGDDDGLLPGALDRVDAVIRDSGCVALTSAWCYYRWPSPGHPQPLLSVPLGGGYEVRRSQEWLGRLMRGLAQYFELPWLYTGGFASIDVIRRAVDDGGRFFRSRIPDVYSAIALASMTERYAVIRTPIAVSGISGHSTGQSYSTGHDRTAAERFTSEENLPIHPRLGSMWPTWSMPLIVYESYLQAGELHHDALNVEMAEALGLALSECDGDGRAALEAYITHVAEQNEVDLARVRRFARSPAIGRAMARNRKRLQWFAFSRLIDGAHGAQNVLEASWVANAVYGEMMERRFWRARQIADRLRLR